MPIEHWLRWTKEQIYFTHCHTYLHNRIFYILLHPREGLGKLSVIDGPPITLSKLPMKVHISKAY